MMTVVVLGGERKLQLAFVVFDEPQCRMTFIKRSSPRA